MNLKTNETGRSMIEMLGVLAIIGVLSVGGIAGYTSAMRSYRANEIVNATSMLYMMGIAQNAGAGDAEMVYSTHFGANAVPSGADEITYNADKTITLAITDADICNQVKIKLGDKATGECPNLTVNFGEINAITIEPDPEEDPSTGGYYECNGDMGDGALLSWDKASDDEPWNFNCPPGTNCKIIIDKGFYFASGNFSSLAEAKRELCVIYPTASAACNESTDPSGCDYYLCITCGGQWASDNSGCLGVTDCSGA